MHLGGSILRDREAAQVSHQHDEEGGGVHAAGLLGVTGRHFLRADLLRLVHHRGEQRAQA